MANRITWAMPYRPALARLRRSTRYAVLGLAAIAIAGCDERANAGGERHGPYRDLAGFQGDDVKVFTDPETGCEYLVRDGYKQGGMTIRLGRDGKPICAEGK